MSGLRFYSTKLSRWISRDPLREKSVWEISGDIYLEAGDKNGATELYVAMGNAPTCLFDSLGLAVFIDPETGKIICEGPCELGQVRDPSELRKGQNVKWQGPVEYKWSNYIGGGDCLRCIPHYTGHYIDECVLDPSPERPPWGTPKSKWETKVHADSKVMKCKIVGDTYCGQRPMVPRHNYG